MCTYCFFPTVSQTTVALSHAFKPDTPDTNMHTNRDTTEKRGRRSMIIETTSVSEKRNDTEGLGLNTLLMSAQGCAT